MGVHTGGGDCEGAARRRPARRTGRGGDRAGVSAKVRPADTARREGPPGRPQGPLTCASMRSDGAPMAIPDGPAWRVLYPTYASRKGAQLLIVERVRHTHKQNKHRAVRFRTRISLSASQLFVGLKRKREHCLCRFLPTEICGKLRISRPCAKLSMCRYVVCFIMLYMFVWRISRETGVALSRSGAFRPATNKRGRSRVRVGASRGTGAVWSLNMGRSPPGCSAGGASGRIRRISRCPKVRSLESVAKPAVPGARAFRRRATAVSRPARISDLQRAPPETRTDWAVR